MHFPKIPCLCFSGLGFSFSVTVVGILIIIPGFGLVVFLHLSLGF